MGRVVLGQLLSSLMTREQITLINVNTCEHRFLKVARLLRVCKSESDDCRVIPGRSVALP